MSKIQKLKRLAQMHYQKAIAGVSTIMLASAASAQSTDLESVLDTFVASIMTGIGTTFEKIGPLLALVFGVAFAWRWLRKGSHS